jgi:hypothetical protein
MARRMTKAETSLLALLILVGLPVVAFTKLFETTGFVIPLILLGTGIAGYIWYKSNKHKERLRYLMDKYQDASVVDKIMSDYIWQRQTSEQLRDSIGAPAAVDNQVLKTKTKEIWKYGHQGGNHFNLRVTVENNQVIGWNKKA